MNTENYIVPNWPGFSSLWKLIALLLLLLVLVLYFLGYGPGGDNCPTCEVPDTVAVERVAAPVITPPVPASTITAPVEIVEITPAMPEAETVLAETEEIGLLDYVVPEYKYREAFSPERLYFDLGSYALPTNSATALSSVIAYLRNNDDSVAVISGYHDDSGNLVSNQRLAKNRATEVHDYLIRLNFDEDRLVLEKPLQSTGTGDAAEARRVEVGIADLIH